MKKPNFFDLRTLLVAAVIFLIVISASFSKSIQTESVTRINVKPRAIPEKPISTSIHSEAPLGYVVVKFKDINQVRLNTGSLYSKTGASMAQVNTSLSAYLPNRVNRLFKDFTEEDLDLKRNVLTAKSKHQLADMNGYYQIDVSSASEAQQLVNSLNALEEVEIAYFQPAPEPAGIFEESTVPNYEPNQDYLEPAPDGVDANFAKTLPGGDGTDIMIIDIEGAWRSTHVDLTSAIGSHIAGTQINDIGWRNHGTAVIGQMIADDNGSGVTGICPGADIGTVSIGSMSTEQALLTAADNLDAGDAILIELHAPGPHYNFQSRPDQLGYVCMEYWQANFDAILYCWAKGIVVVEAAGNGAEDFDNFIYYNNLFDTTFRNSHAIIAGAGHPPVDFNDLERESFSNYGERVNLQGYGSNIYTTGYGGLYSGGGVEDSFFTATFGGTSGASPIVTGSVACLQGRYKNIYGVTMTSDQVRDILVATGTSQLGNTSQHIGPRPNLQAAFAAITAPPSIYTTPIYFDTTLQESETANYDLWLHNRNTTTAYDYSINDNDSLTKSSIANWLTASPNNGTIAPQDSALINVNLDASLVGDRIRKYSGILEISWGITAGSLDSISYVPVFMQVPCFDTTYSSISSDDSGGPTFTWISARTLGTKVTNTSYYNTAPNPLDDGTTGPHSIGFDFPYYDTTYDEMYIGVNGALSFTDEHVNFGGYFGFLDIPNTDFETIVSAFWNDLIFDTGLIPQAGLFIYRSPTNDTCVIEWFKPSSFNTPFDTTINFEIILTADGKITCQYLDIGIGGNENTATIGIAGIECKARAHYVLTNPMPENVVSNSETVQFNNNTWDYVWGGDCDYNGAINLLDLNFTVNYVFRSGPGPVPFVLGDADCNGTPMNILDLNYLVNYVFRSGPPTCRFILYY